MFKKLLFIFLLIFSVFGLIACDGGENTDDIDTTENIDVPVNLAITAKTLTWDAVVGATGYIIYVNNEEKQTVTTTSYDFSSLSGDNLVFQVVTKAPSGMDNSAKSVTIAYMANPTAEITAINLVLDQMIPNGPEGIAEELVRKGVTGTNMQTLKTAFDLLRTEINAAQNDPLLVNAAVKKFLATDISYEAIVSAGLVAMVPQMDYQIAEVQEEITYYQDMIDEYGPDEYYESRVSELNEQKTIMTDMKSMLVDSRDEMVLVASNTIQYLIDFQKQITNDLITKIDDIVEAENTSELTAAEFVVVKDEIIDLFLENMPSLDDLALVYELLATGYGQLLESNEFTTLLSSSSASFAATTKLSMEFMLKLLDSFDNAFFTEVLALVNGDNSDEVIGSEIAILVVTYVKNFKDDNEALIDAIEAVFTEAQKEALYQGYMQTVAALIEKSGADVGTIIISSDITYAMMNDVQAVFEDMMDKLVTKFVGTDGELLRKIVIVNSFTYDYNWQTYEPENYRNVATGETYADEDAYYEARAEADFVVLKEAISYYAPTLGTLTDNQITSIIDLLVAGVPVSEIALQLEMTVIEAQAIVDLVEGLLRSVLPDLNNLVKGIMNYIVSNDIITKMQTLQSDIESYFVTTYGANYYDNPAYYEDDYESSVTAIFMAKHLNSFFTSANQTLVRGIITDVATFAKNESIYSFMEATLTDITDAETKLNDVFDDLISLSAIIKDYNASALTTEQILKIQELTDLFINFSFGPEQKTQ
ncbi:MAG: hypothetical protein AB7V00_01575 [Bacilli bacterium]